MKNYLFLLPLFVLLSFSCTKNKKETGPQLPPLTQTGAGTFGCKVNGRIYLPGGNGYLNFAGPNPTFSIGNMGGKFKLWISADVRNEPKEAFSVSVPYDKRHGTYQTEYTYPYGASFQGFVGGIDTVGFYGTDSTHIVRVTVTNFTTKTISGTFEGQMRSKAGIEVHITEGRFDLSTK